MPCHVTLYTRPSVSFHVAAKQSWKPGNEAMSKVYQPCDFVQDPRYEITHKHSSKMIMRS